MNLHHLLDTIERESLPVDPTMVRLAYDCAAKAHAGQRRLSGEPYIAHPTAVAVTLAGMRLDETTIVAALLHDVPEDAGVPLSTLEREFGTEVARLVAGVTKLGTIKYRGVERYLENLRKMFVALASDVRVVLIKFADRLNNLHTLNALPPVKQKRIARETMEIYAPIADRLGMGEMKGALEDLSFPFLYPEEAAWIDRLVAERSRDQARYLERVERVLAKDLAGAGIRPSDIHGRAKHRWSLYRKLMSHERDIDRVYDLVALRIIVADVAACYATLGVIHHRWRPLKGRIKDYIATPKPNGYQSLHTTVFCEEGRIVELQVRSAEMHQRAEFGIAAHWHYKHGARGAPPPPEWLRQLTQTSTVLSQRTIENLKLDFFKSRIFVFTPKGDVVDLPEHSTPIDFAYQIHSDVGNRAVLARINEQVAKLTDTLKSGDICKIVIDKKKVRPSAEWLRIVKTQTAREQIKRALKGRT